MLGLSADHEIRVFVVNGSEAHFTLREMLALYKSKPLWLLIAVGFFVMSTGHPITLPQFEHVGLRMAFWIISLSIYVVLSFHYSYYVYRFWRRWVNAPIPHVLLSPWLTIFVTWVTVAGLTMAFLPDRTVLDSMTWQLFLRNLFVAHIFEVVALLWLLPAQRARRQMVYGRTVTLGGKTWPLSTIKRVKAAEHYLELHGTDGSELIRERMATFLGQVHPEDGIQTHRSHWIARAHVRKIRGGVMELDCGTSIPIARGRRDEVRDWLATFQPEPAIHQNDLPSPEPQSVSQ